ncbi:hypothetical protein PRZ48_013458 [Zasmidium cellare]|uniref:Aminoglycoside phosphotransferase domain-containing protein n=1 Tax=Zasmidium cellare TaxID=395010 RepID=A0ABR0E1Q3_ZASCE|nr:hypothetical protein PRZ48_013458 [Zasmidium cellare]
MEDGLQEESKRKIDYEYGDGHTPAINDTFFYRLFIKLALKTLGLFHKSDGLCTPISKRLIVKTGHRIRLTEAATMKYIGEHTSIPVPKVYCSFVYNRRACILMERIQGDDLPAVWDGLSEDGRQKVYAQLRTIIDELRALKPPPGTGVESCTGGSLYDGRIPRSPELGPFKTIQDFHLWLREGFNPSEARAKAQGEVAEEVWERLEKMVKMQEGPWPAPVFTHGDLNPFNILLRGDQVVGIIDWEFAGWYPHYWEYTSAWYGNLLRSDWQKGLYQFLDPFPAELEMEITRQKWWGEW